MKDKLLNTVTKRFYETETVAHKFSNHIERMKQNRRKINK